MKIRIITLIAITAIITLSFTFASVKEKSKKGNYSSVNNSSGEIAGGFVSDEK